MHPAALGTREPTLPWPGSRGTGLEPDLYDRLVGVERLHPAVVGWLPDDVERIVEVAAGTGRLTLKLSERS